MSTSSRAASRLLAGLTLAASLACQLTPTSEDAYTLVQPKTEPTRTITSFSPALACMDSLFVTHGVRGIQITSIGLPDQTGQVTVGSREMLISAISQMTRKSTGFVYADYELDRVELNYLHENAEQKVSPKPVYYIRGAISQLDQNVLDWRKGGGLTVQSGGGEYEGDVAIDKNQTGSVVALDMNVGLVQTREIIPGLTASNSLAVSRKGGGKEVGLTIKQVGAFFSLEVAESEGMHYAVRSLIELGAVELLGKIAQVPYWKCLQVEGTNPAIMAEAANWYADMSEKEKLVFVQRVLVGNGYLQAPTSGTLDDATRSAISSYEVDHGLVPSGRLGFDLYYKMLGSDRSVAKGPPRTLPNPKKAPDFVADQVPKASPVVVTIKSLRGSQPVYAPMDQLQLSVTPSKNAYVYCYYRDGDAHVSRIFPNRFQPDPYVAGGSLVQIPGPGAEFEIQFQKAGVREEVACFGSEREIGLQLPTNLKARDLEPLPVKSLEELTIVFQSVDREGLGTARLPVVVTAR